MVIREGTPLPGNAGSRIQFGFPRNRRDVIQFPRFPPPPPPRRRVSFSQLLTQRRVFEGFCRLIRHTISSSFPPRRRSFHPPSRLRHQTFRAYVREISPPFLSLSLSPLLFIRRDHREYIWATYHGRSYYCSSEKVPRLSLSLKKFSFVEIVTADATWKGRCRVSDSLRDMMGVKGIRKWLYC